MLECKECGRWVFIQQKEFEEVSGFKYFCRKCDVLKFENEVIEK